MISLQAVFNDPVTGLEVSAYKSLAKFESRDNESIQVSASLPDGAIKVRHNRGVLNSVISMCFYILKRYFDPVGWVTVRKRI